MTKPRLILILLTCSPALVACALYWSYVFDPAYLGVDWQSGIVVTLVAGVWVYFFGVLSRETWEAAA